MRAEPSRTAMPSGSSSSVTGCVSGTIEPTDATCRSVADAGSSSQQWTATASPAAVADSRSAIATTSASMVAGIRTKGLGPGGSPGGVACGSGDAIACGSGGGVVSGADASPTSGAGGRKGSAGRTSAAGASMEGGPGSGGVDIRGTPSNAILGRA